jgi:hypothetical protein
MCRGVERCPFLVSGGKLNDANNSGADDRKPPD